MKRALAVVGLGVGLAFSLGGVRADDDDDDHWRGPRADHTTFTSQFEDYFVCGCPRQDVCRVTATISNFGGGSDRVDVKFQDGDLVTLFVPAETTHSLTQMMGTRDDKPVDDVVKFDPQAAASANPIVAWVSIERLGSGSGRKHEFPPFGCTTVPYHP